MEVIHVCLSAARSDVTSKDLCHVLELIIYTYTMDIDGLTVPLDIEPKVIPDESEWKIMILYDSHRVILKPNLQVSEAKPLLNHRRFKSTMGHSDSTGQLLERRSFCTLQGVFLLVFFGSKQSFPTTELILQTPLVLDVVNAKLILWSASWC